MVGSLLTLIICGSAGLTADFTETEGPIAKRIEKFRNVYFLNFKSLASAISSRRPGSIYCSTPGTCARLQRRGFLPVRGQPGSQPQRPKETCSPRPAPDRPRSSEGMKLQCAIRAHSGTPLVVLMRPAENTSGRLLRSDWLRLPPIRMVGRRARHSLVGGSSQPYPSKLSCRSSRPSGAARINTNHYEITPTNGTHDFRNGNHQRRLTTGPRRTRPWPAHSPRPRFAPPATANRGGGRRVSAS